MLSTSSVLFGLGTAQRVANRALASKSFAFRWDISTATATAEET